MPPAVLPKRVRARDTLRGIRSAKAGRVVKVLHIHKVIWLSGGVERYIFGAAREVILEPDDCVFCRAPDA